MKRFYLPKPRLTSESVAKAKVRLLWRRLIKQKQFDIIFRPRVPEPVKRRGVSVLELFEVFDELPDDGAAYFVRLCATLPVAGDPSASMNFSGVLKMGHGFLEVGKEQGGNIVSRAFGLYPAERMSLWSPLAPHSSIIRNDRRHLPHAFLEKPMTALDFEVVRVLAIAGAWTGYELLTFNCTGYALAVFNAVDAAPLVLPPYRVHWKGIPIGYHRLPSRHQIVIPNTPQGLFLAIHALAAAGVPGARIADAIGHRSR